MPRLFPALLAIFAISTCATVAEEGLSAAGAAREKALESEADRVLDVYNDDKTVDGTKQVSYKSPVQRVVMLLKKMVEELHAEQKKEAELYDKMVCWCETNEKEKDKAVSDADTKISELEAEIEERGVLSGKLLVLIDKMKLSIKEYIVKKEEALSIREGEHEDFKSREAELVRAIARLKNAIIVLKKHQGADLLQSSSPLVTALRAVLRDVAVQYDMLQGDSQSSGGPNILSQRLETALIATRATTERASGQALAAQKVARSILSALDARGSSESDVEQLPMKFADQLVTEAATRAQAKAGTSLVQQPSANAGSYSSGSGVIFGILEQMKEDFEKELGDITGAEQKAVIDYKSFYEELISNLEIAKKKLDMYQEEYYKNKKLLIDAKQLLELVRAQRSKDVEFLRNLRLTCQELDHQWALRTKARMAEIKAVSEALAILQDDDNREATAKAIALLEEESTTTARARMNAAAALRKAAQQPGFDMDDLLAQWNGRSSARPALANVGGPRAQLSTLAVSVELDAFTKVKAAMDKLIAELKAEQKEEVELKLFCEEEFDENEKMTYTKTEEKKDLEAKIESLTKLVEKLTGEIEAAKERIVEAKKEIKFASEDREAENAEYQGVVADQRAAQVIMKKVLNKLASVYKTQKRGNFLIQEGQTPPVQFAPQKQHGGSSVVMGLIEQIIEDSKKTEAEAVKAEAEAQAGYETFVKDSNGEVASLTAMIVTKTKATEGAKLDMENAESDLEATNAELESLASYLADLHDQCDFVVKNFDIRQKARLNEIEAIQEAKAILSGAK